MIKSFKYRIYPTKDQEIQIVHTMNVCRLVYNLALEVKRIAWSSARINIGAYELEKQIVDLRNEYPWIKTVDSQALAMMMKKVELSYQHFFDGGGFPKFKKKSISASYATRGRHSVVDWENETINLPKIKGIKAVLSNCFLNND